MASQCENGALGHIFTLLNLCTVYSIGAVMHIHNQNSNILGRPPNVVKVIFHTIRNCF